jgi:tripartite ATP-independent transporter DctM subunit
MGKITYPEMRRYGYSETLASGCIAAGGTLGVLIPPSVMFILYGIFTETSIGALFIAGIIPGLLEILFYCVTIYIWCRLHPNAGPPGPRVNFKEKVISLRAVTPMVIVFVAVMAGIYGGIVTPTEAGALGAVGAIVVGLAMRRLKWKPFVNSISETATSVAMVIFLLIGAFIFMRFAAISQVAIVLGEYVAGLALPNWLIIAAIMAVYIICGMFLNPVATMIITLPVVMPIILAMGYSPIWWGVIMVRTIEIAMITPPVGINVFVLSKATNLPVSTIYKGIGPFVVADILHVALLLAVPELSLFLVAMMN